MVVRELLEFEILRDAEPTVLSGEDQLDRPVRWVHSGEIADIAQYLSGGEVLLTAATELAARGAGDRRRYIRELAECNVAALILELGRGFAAAPPEMVDEARARGLVLVELAREVPFVGVTQAAHVAIVSESNEALARAIEIGDAVSQALIDGDPLPAMLELLAERLGNPVVLEDTARHVVAFGRASMPLTSVLRSWQRHSRQGHARGAEARVQVAESEPRCAWCAVAIRGEIWGRLHVLEVDSPLDAVAQLALGRAAASVALHLVAERDASLSEAAEQSLIQDLARGVSFSSEEFVARASGLGVDLEGDLILLVIGPPQGASDEHMDAVRDAMRKARWPSIVGPADGQVVAVAAGNPEAGLHHAVRALAETLGDELHVGVGRVIRASLLPRAYTEARLAHRIGSSSGVSKDGSNVHRYDDLVLHRLLAPLMHSPELATFVEGELGELLAYDADNHAQLVDTLNVYLQCNGNKAATAQALFLQRRSVYYRLDRIEKLLGRSLESPAERVRLYVALRARELLDARTAQSAG